MAVELKATSDGEPVRQAEVEVATNSPRTADLTNQDGLARVSVEPNATPRLDVTYGEATTTRSLDLYWGQFSIVREASITNVTAGERSVIPLTVQWPGIGPTPDPKGTLYATGADGDLFGTVDGTQAELEIVDREAGLRTYQIADADLCGIEPLETSQASVRVQPAEVQQLDVECGEPAYVNLSVACTAIGRDAYGNVNTTNVTDWTVDVGSVNDIGVQDAVIGLSGQPGNHTVQATTGNLTGTATIDVLPAPKPDLEVPAVPDTTAGAPVQIPVQATDRLGLDRIELLTQGRITDTVLLDGSRSAQANLSAMFGQRGSHEATVRVWNVAEESRSQTFSVWADAAKRSSGGSGGAANSGSPGADTGSDGSTESTQTRDETAPAPNDEPEPSHPDRVLANATPTSEGGTVHTATVRTSGGVAPTVTVPDEGLSIDLESSQDLELDVRVTPKAGLSSLPSLPFPVVDSFGLDVSSPGSSVDPVDGARLGFEVSNSQLEAHSATADGVRLAHWTGSHWERLPTTHEGSDDDSQTFSAQTRSLSPFAVELTDAASTPDDTSSSDANDEGPEGNDSQDAAVIARSGTANRYSATVTAEDFDDAVQVNADDGTFELSITPPAPGTYELEVRVSQTPPPGTPKAPTDQGRYFAIQLTGPNGDTVTPRSTRLTANLATEGERASTWVLAGALDDEWRTIEAQRSGDPGTVTLSGSGADVSRYAALLDDRTPRIGLPEAVPDRVDGTYTFQPAASDNLEVRRVQLFDNGTLVDTDSNRPFELQLSSADLAPGDHHLTLSAEDAAGNVERIHRNVTIGPDGAIQPAQEPAGDRDGPSGAANGVPLGLAPILVALGATYGVRRRLYES